MDTNGVIFIVVLVVLAVLALLVIPQWRMRRAMRQVIRIFEEKNAISVESAKTLDELGLKPKGILEGGFRVRRDFKPQALISLVSAEIIQITEDGRYYLSKEKFIGSEYDRPTPYYR